MPDTVLRVGTLRAEQNRNTCVITAVNPVGAAACFCAQNCILTSCIIEGVLSFRVEHKGSIFQND